MISREQRFWVCDPADPRTCHELIADTMPPARTQLFTDAGQRSHGRPAAHATVGPRAREWAREAQGDGNARSTATLVQGQEQRSARICVPSGGSTSSPCLRMWRRMKPWSRQNASRPL